jgi:hypothetical protein
MGEACCFFLITRVFYMFGHKQILDCLYMVLVEDGGGKYSFS